jgi:hypothetical protein
MLDEWSPVRGAPLSGMLPFRELKREPSFWKLRYHIG